jgi:adenylate cyclase
VADAMKEIMATSDLSRRVEIIYRDETGELGHSFNLMTGALEKAYQSIKGYAFKAVIAQHKEQKIRNIFQRYVPKDVIEEFFANPESMLVGQDRIVAVLFSDIRSFTSMSESMMPSEVVDSLNAYFHLMVDVITGRKGVVDKYIGDAIMATWGAAGRSTDSAYQSVMAGFEMLEALKGFNETQAGSNRPPFHIGIGINYGNVTVGNIGHQEKKMDYTVIGDMVNLASRLEGQTKVYKESMIVSESVQRKLEGKVPCRSLGKVVVKGRRDGVGIFAPRREVSPVEAEAWALHETAMKGYYAREFREAEKGFREVLKMLPRDAVARMFVERCTAHAANPPGEDWTGAVVMQEK